jgi:hypothetical protein
MDQVLQKHTRSGASALQVRDDDGSHIVGIKNIRVAIYPSGKFWIAQGLQIDYVSQGSDPEDAKRTFEDGLAVTIHQYLKIHGDIDKLLRPAPADVRAMVLDKVFENPNSIHAKFSQVSVHNLAPIQIEYLEMAAAA